MIEADRFWTLVSLQQKDRTFQELVDESSRNRSTMRAVLDVMINDGLVIEINRETWCRGKKLYFGITDKGKAFLLNESKSMRARLQKIIDLGEAKP